MSALSSLRTFLVLGRVSNLPTVWTNVAVGWFLTGGGWTAEFAWILTGVSLIYIAGMTLNDAFDAEWDRVHAPERPIPSACITRETVWVTGLLQMGLGVMVLLRFSTAWPSLVAALVVAVVLYDWLHKRWAGSVIVMGVCRALVYGIAGSAVASQTDGLEIPHAVFVIAAFSVFYIAGLTLAARSERLSTHGDLGLVPRLMLILPTLFPLIAARGITPSLMRTALIITGIVVIMAWISMMRRSLAEHIPKGIAQALAGIALYDAAALPFADMNAALAALACFILTLGLQRVIPAT